MTITDLRLEALRRGRPRRVLGLRLCVYGGAFVLGLVLGWVLGR